MRPEPKRRAVVLALGSLLASGHAGSAQAQAASGDERVVARLFGRDVTAGQLQWTRSLSVDEAAHRLRALAIGAALERYVRDNKLAATAEDIAAFSRWDATFRRSARSELQAALQRIEGQLQDKALPAALRKELDEQRRALQTYGALQEARSARPLGPGEEERALRSWIEGHKLRRALYEQYGGRVVEGRIGQDPVGAMETLLREHEKVGRLRFVDAQLAEPFWRAFRNDAQPAVPAGQVDFSYYWLRPAPQLFN